MQVKQKTAGAVDRWAIVIPWLLTIATAAVGLYQFSEQEREANRHPFLEHQLAISEEASKVTASLATETDPKEWEKQRLLFWQLYWGRLAIFEDRDVEARMVSFGRALPNGPVPKERLPMRSLEQPSLELAHAARDMIAHSWNVELAALPTVGLGASEAGK